VRREPRFSLRPAGTFVLHGRGACALIAWTLVIAVRQGRTPVEMITPRLDRVFVAKVRRA
jgi:hypothetical protein